MPDLTMPDLTITDAAADPPAIAPVDPADRPPRFRWRLIPAFLCGTYGGAALLIGLANTAALLWLVRRGATFGLSLLPAFLSAGAMTVGGGALIVGTVLMWRGRSRLTLGLIETGVAALLLNGWFGVPTPL